MIEIQNIERESYHPLNRILPGMEGILKTEIKKDRLVWGQFSSRYQRNFPALFTLPLHAAQIQHSNKDPDHEK